MTGTRGDGGEEGRGDVARGGADTSQVWRTRTLKGLVGSIGLDAGLPEREPKRKGAGLEPDDEPGRASAVGANAELMGLSSLGLKLNSGGLNLGLRGLKLNSVGLKLNSGGLKLNSGGLNLGFGELNLNSVGLTASPGIVRGQCGCFSASSSSMTGALLGVVKENSKACDGGGGVGAML